MGYPQFTNIYIFQTNFCSGILFFRNTKTLTLLISVLQPRNNSFVLVINTKNTQLQFSSSSCIHGAIIKYFCERVLSKHPNLVRVPLQNQWVELSLGYVCDRRANMLSKLNPYFFMFLLLKNLTDLSQSVIG